MRSMIVLLGCVFVLSSCAEEAFVPVVDLPDPPDQGVQIVLKQVTLQPGEDIEFCTYFNLETAAMLAAKGARAFDDDGNVLDSPFLLQDITVNGVDLDDAEIAIEKIDIIASPGLHHVQLLALENDTWDYADRHIFECGVDLFGGPLTGDVEPLFFTSLPDYSVTYKPGTARILKSTADLEDATKTRGAQLLYNFHYLNPTDQPMIAEVVVNFHTVDRSTVVHPIRSAWWNYIYFKTAANAASEVDASGSFLVDVNLVGMTSHQHELGSLFTFNRGDQEVYRNDTWAEPSYVRFPDDTVLAKGAPLDFHCEWNNPLAEDRYFGLQANDEMCTAIVEYHPVDEAAADALLQMQREERDRNGGEDQGIFGGDSVTLEDFLPLPKELVDEVSKRPDDALEILDRDIMCGVTANLKEMEAQYGRSPDNLSSLQQMADVLAEFCDL